MQMESDGSPISSPYALSCSATNDEGLKRVTQRILSSLSSLIPSASANETSARSRTNWVPPLIVWSWQVLRSSSTQRPVNRPSTLSLTPSADDSTTVTFIPVMHPREDMQSVCQSKKWIADWRSFPSKDFGKGH